MTQRFLILATSLLVLQRLTTCADAAIVTVPNHSFEADVVPDVNASPGATGWNTIGEPATDNPPANAFAGAGGQGTPTGGAGPQSAILPGNAAFYSAVALDTVQSGTTYTLTLAIGDRNDGTEPGILEIGFFVGSEFALGSTTTFAGADYSPEGTFRDFTFAYTAPPSEAGRALKIFVGQTGEGNIVNFDNVRLVSSVPEPASMLLLAAGAAVCSLRNRGR